MSFIRICPACGARNLIERFEVRREARCGVCKHRLKEPFSVWLLRMPYRNQAWLVVIAVVGLWSVKDPFWAALGLRPEQASSSPTPARLAAQVPGPFSPDDTPVGASERPQLPAANIPGPLPSAVPPKVVDPDAGLIPVPIEQGALFRQAGLDFVAPLSVTTPAGQERYYVKLVSVATNEAVLMFMVDPGTTFRTKAPLGEYRLRYATGVTWFGPKHLFGARTRYFEAEHTFDFRINGDQVAGFRVELVKQLNGNLQTTRITAGHF